ncbi:hypothetical protein [Fluviispira multicolorata]|uniref:Cytochrome c family protein n=1 Tax=Fluviispira multicolorata TaxID=2654512 RepID=A0A833JBD2_9BACT|nr:hypothetical protein [Fluviispira multicolorata]KAB8029099.1 hypothetical protein GCL57_11200 [Fluviispira multicolorata]
MQFNKLIFLFLNSIYFPCTFAANDPVPGNCSTPPQLNTVIPTDMSVPNSQVNANCFAWQEFIALNWLADTSICAADSTVKTSDFGEINNFAPVVWETYKESAEIFLPQAQQPTPWCSQQTLPKVWNDKLKSIKKTSAHGYKALASISKGANNAEVLNLNSYGQAGTKNSWITSQAGKIALYEIRVNQDEFNYINNNQLYNAQVQQKFVVTQGINLPDGSATFTQYGKIGSIELKASWVELPDPKTWPSFKISKAVVKYPNENTPKEVTVGLTGLHIIHKTKRSPQFIWATFEHINNAPNSDKKNMLPWYTFYNLNCNPNTDHYHCYPNAQPPTASPQNPYFPNYPTDPYNAPIQVMRMAPISNTGANNVAGLNKWVWDNVISPANSQSVFLNYQLVNVVWANNPEIIQAGARTPLPDGNPQPNPSSFVVANTTLETYFQQTKSCLTCHQNAGLQQNTQNTNAKSKSQNNLKGLAHMLHLLKNNEKSISKTTTDSNNPYASDYSFLFYSATNPAPSSNKK